MLINVNFPFLIFLEKGKLVQTTFSAETFENRGEICETPLSILKY